MTKKFYNIEGLIRNGFKLSQDYEVLDFNFTKLGDAGVIALTKSKSLRQLKRLIIPLQKLGPDSAKAIAESEKLGNLEYLKLYKNKIGDDGLKHFASSDKLPKLKSLRLGWNEIGPKGPVSDFSPGNLDMYPTGFK